MIFCPLLRVFVGDGDDECEGVSFAGFIWPAKDIEGGAFHGFCGSGFASGLVEPSGSVGRTRMTGADCAIDIDHFLLSDDVGRGERTVGVDIFDENHILC